MCNEMCVFHRCFLSEFLTRPTYTLCSQGSVCPAVSKISQDTSKVNSEVKLYVVCIKEDPTYPGESYY